MYIPSAIVVDDEYPSGQLLRDSIESNGGWHVIATFTSPEEALQWVHSSGPSIDAAFLDIGMPGMDGIELGRRFRAERPQMEIIYVTGRQDRALDAYSIDAFGYLVKPAIQQDIDRLTKRFLRLHGGQPEAPSCEPRKTLSTVRFFGSFQLSVGEPDAADAIHWRTRKAKELFVLLLLKGMRGITIDRLIELLWPDAHEKKARSMLHTTMYQMKGNLDESGVRYDLVQTEGYYRMSLPDCWMDIAIFQQAMDALGLSKSLADASLRVSVDSSARMTRKSDATEAERIEIVEEAFQLYSGGFMATEGYEWADYLATVFQEAMLAMVTFLAEHHYQSGNAPKATQLLHSALAQVPWAESLHMLLLRHYKDTGNHAAFIRQYRRMEQSLRLELGVAPSAICRHMLSDVLSHRDRLQ